MGFDESQFLKTVNEAEKAFGKTTFHE